MSKTWGKEQTIEQAMKEFDYDGDTKVTVDEFTNRNMDKTQQMLVMKVALLLIFMVNGFPGKLYYTKKSIEVQKDKGEVPYLSPKMNTYKRGKAKVAWDDICLPKSEGGLGLR
ncbi:sodium/calcium exchanger membrane region, EF-hand domain pair containing protein, partial [Tanacetum coccineum]